MACSLRAVVTCGIILAVLDVFHGLATTGFYGYQFIVESFYLCPLDLPIDKCHNKNYVYEQMFEMRVYIGIGEGIVGVLFALFYVMALVKRKPSLTWLWLLKSFAIIAINIFYLSSWLIRQESYDYIKWEKAEYEDDFVFTAQALTLAQIIIMVVYCLIGGVFTYKVCEERTASRRSLNHKRKWDSSNATAPPLDNYDEEEALYLNKALTNSEKTLPVRASRNSLSELSRADTFKHSTGV